MGRSVADAAALLTALAGADPSDAATQDAAAHASDYTKALDPNGLKGARIGVARNMAGFHPDTDKLFEDALAEMKRQGAEIVDPAGRPGHQGPRRPRVRGAALRVQGGPARLLRHARSERAGQDFPRT
jgi:Asp-tRNA(Asn)/Glu-tRNA(Gln) amidotransferase A subunit family amidase